MPDPARYFPADPADARARFRAAAESAGWRFESHPLSSTGPAGEPLAVDAAVWPGTDPARPAVVVTGGVHGVEAPLGVAAVLALMGHHPAPAGRVVVVPVVNPWGYAHGRRTDAANVDLNRNFRLPGEPYHGRPPLYHKVDPTLNPPSPPPRIESFRLTAFGSVLRHGYRALKESVAGGQYDFPRGLFYGGPGPAEAHKLLAGQWARWVQPVPGRRDIHVDIHTGLGGWGTYKLLLDAPITPDRVARAEALGDVQVADSAGVSYEATGGFGPWATATAGPADLLYVCAEFGTYPGLTVLGGMRRENRAHHYAPGTATDRRAKWRMRELFAPASPGWRRRTLADAVAVLGRAVAG